MSNVVPGVPSVIIPPGTVPVLRRLIGGAPERSAKGKAQDAVRGILGNRAFRTPGITQLRLAGQDFGPDFPGLSSARGRFIGGAAGSGLLALNLGARVFGFEEQFNRAFPEAAQIIAEGPIIEQRLAQHFAGLRPNPLTVRGVRRFETGVRGRSVTPARTRSTREVRSVDEPPAEPPAPEGFLGGLTQTLLRISDLIFRRPPVLGLPRAAPVPTGTTPPTVGGSTIRIGTGRGGARLPPVDLNEEDQVANVPTNFFDIGLSDVLGAGVQIAQAFTGGGGGGGGGGFNAAQIARRAGAPAALPGGAMTTGAGDLIERGLTFLGEAVAPGGGSVCISPSASGRWKSRFIVPTRSGNIASYKYQGTPVLWSGEVSGFKSTRKKLRKFGRVGGR